MGIDPGTNLMGYAFVRTGTKKPRLIAMGTLDMRKLETPIDKIRFIFEDLQRLIKIYEPAEMAIEAPFFHKDVQAMLKLGRSQGVAMAAGFATGIPVAEYLPKVVKKAITGNGNAAKEQVAKMLPHLIDGEIVAQYADATDALGIAVCHIFQSQQMLGGGKSYSGWGAFIKDNPNKVEKIKTDK